MIKETYQLYFQISDQNQLFNISPTLNISNINSVCINYLAIPNIINTIKTDFYITIDGVQINFKEGLISFQQMINKIQKALPNTYIVREYLKNTDQSSNKLFIKNGNSLVQFTISDPNYIHFFGSPYFDQVQFALISDHQCVIQTPNLLVVHSNCVSTPYLVFDNNDVLYIQSLNQTSVGNYLTLQNTRIIENRRPFSQVRQFQFKITDQYNNQIKFPGSQIEIGVTIFNYQTQFIHTLVHDLKSLLKLYAIKNFDKEIDYLQDEYNDEEQQQEQDKKNK